MSGSSTRLAITAHLAVRMRQRGYRLGDYETVEALGSQIRDGIVLLKRDVEGELKQASGGIAEPSSAESCQPQTGRRD